MRQLRKGRSKAAFFPGLRVNSLGGGCWTRWGSRTSPPRPSDKCRWLVYPGGRSWICFSALCFSFSPARASFRANSRTQDRAPESRPAWGAALRAGGHGCRRRRRPERYSRPQLPRASPVTSLVSVCYVALGVFLPALDCQAGSPSLELPGMAFTFQGQV